MGMTSRSSGWRDDDRQVLNVGDVLQEIGSEMLQVGVGEFAGGKYVQDERGSLEKKESLCNI